MQQLESINFIRKGTYVLIRVVRDTELAEITIPYEDFQAMAFHMKAGSRVPYQWPIFDDGEMSKQGEYIVQVSMINDLRRKINEWEHYHVIQLEHENVTERSKAREKRDAIGKEIESIGFIPCYVDGQLMLIVH